MPRIYFDFSDQAMADILTLQQAQEAETLGDVLWQALCLYATMHKALRQGYKVGLVDNGGKVHMIELP